MVADLIFRSKFVYSDGAIREMVLWKLPKRTPANPHGFKYRLHITSTRMEGRMSDMIVKKAKATTAISELMRNLTSLLTQKHSSPIFYRTLNAYEEVSREEKYEN